MQQRHGQTATAGGYLHFKCQHQGEARSLTQGNTPTPNSATAPYLAITQSTEECGWAQTAMNDDPPRLLMTSVAAIQHQPTDRTPEFHQDYKTTRPQKKHTCAGSHSNINRRHSASSRGTTDCWHGSISGQHNRVFEKEVRQSGAIKSASAPTHTAVVLNLSLKPGYKCSSWMRTFITVGKGTHAA